MLVKSALQLETVNCVLCTNPVQLLKKGCNIKSSQWDGTVDLIYSRPYSSLLAIGICTACTKKSVESGSLVKIEL